MDLESFGQVGADLGGLAKLGTDLAVLLRILLGPTFRTGTPALPRYAPRSVTMRGGPLPSVVERNLEWTYNGSLGGQTGLRVSRRGIEAPLFWKLLGLCWVIFSLFFTFVSHFGAS